MKKFLTFVIIVIIIALGVWFFYYRNKTNTNNSSNTNTSPNLISQVNYSCDNGKSIQASYYQGEPVALSQGNEPPIPSGSVDLVLSDGRNLNLLQTISASGIRYANNDESIIFWSKGNGAFISENNLETYTNCIAVSPDTGNLPEIYANGAQGFSLRYPSGYKVDTSYKYQELGPGKDISGVKFTISESMATGTNLSSFDTGVSVEEIPNVQDCKADLFLSYTNGVSLVDDNGTSYSVASSTDAGAGNIYEEKVWAIPGTNPCVALRYFIHYSNIGNYPAGAVKEFDKSALLDQFDQIRRSLLLSQ